MTAGSNGYRTAAVLSIVNGQKLDMEALWKARGALLRPGAIH
jgi:hypothetical protein